MGEDRVLVGAIAGAFGVHGDVRLKSFCAEPQAIADYNPLTSKDGEKQFKIKLIKPIKNAFAARIEGVRGKDAADALRGTQLFASRDLLPALPDDEFYHSDLIGLLVVDTGGKELGRVKAIHDHGAGDLLDIHGPGLKNGVMLPFTKDAVPTVDLASGRLIIDPPEGLLDDG